MVLETAMRLVARGVRARLGLTDDTLQKKTSSG
jgi:hypothetical protein